MPEYLNCTLCPRNCGVNRYETVGVCKMPATMRIGRAALHFWEEPCISGTEGSGAIFFGGCNLHCVFCQNAGLSEGQETETATDRKGPGQSCFSGIPEVSVEQLTDIMLTLQQKGANNINLVTASHYVPSVANAIRQAKHRGLTVPILYNCGGYEKVSTLKLLEGLVDIYLPDDKYSDGNLAKEYSHAKDYPEVALEAIAEMVRQTGPCVFDNRGMLQRGVLVRHLLLPGEFMNAVRVVDKLWEQFGDGIYVSIMNQYTPMPSIDRERFPKLEKTVSKRVYEHLIRHCMELGMKQVYIQEGETNRASFIPEFNGEGVRLHPDEQIS